MLILVLYNQHLHQWGRVRFVLLSQWTWRGMSTVRCWAWDLLVQSPTLQNQLPHWNVGDCPERCLSAPQTPSPAAQLCRCGCRPSSAEGSRKIRVVPGHRWEIEELIEKPRILFSCLIMQIPNNTKCINLLYKLGREACESYVGYTNYLCIYIVKNPLCMLITCDIL